MGERDLNVQHPTHINPEQSQKSLLPEEFQRWIKTEASDLGYLTYCAVPAIDGEVVEELSSLFSRQENKSFGELPQEVEGFVREKRLEDSPFLDDYRRFADSGIIPKAVKIWHKRKSELMYLEEHPDMLGNPHIAKRFDSLRKRFGEGNKYLDREFGEDVRAAITRSRKLKTEAILESAIVRFLESVARGKIKRPFDEKILYLMEYCHGGFSFYNKLFIESLGIDINSLKNWYSGHFVDATEYTAEGDNKERQVKGLGQLLKRFPHLEKDTFVQKVLEQSHGYYYARHERRLLEPFIEEGVNLDKWFQGGEWELDVNGSKHKVKITSDPLLKLYASHYPVSACFDIRQIGFGSAAVSRALSPRYLLLHTTTREDMPITERCFLELDEGPGVFRQGYGFGLKIHTVKENSKSDIGIAPSDYYGLVDYRNTKSGLSEYIRNGVLSYADDILVDFARTCNIPYVRSVGSAHHTG